MSRQSLHGLVACALAFCLLAPSPVDAAVILQLKVVDGEGSVYPAGSRATRGITALVTDETGEPVEGAAVSFRLPEDGPGGTFNSGLCSEIVTTKADGRATVWGMQWNKNPGPFDIRITASKDQARAGMVSRLYLNNPLEAKSGGTGTFQAPRHSHKWIWVALAAGAGAGAGVAFGHSKSTGSPSTPGTPSVALQIGSPGITIGHP